MKNKKEIKIEQLRDQSNYWKFELNLFFVAFFTILAFYGALYIGITPHLDLDIQIGFSIVLLILIFLTGFTFKKPILSRISKIKELSKEIHKLYKELL